MRKPWARSPREVFLKLHCAHMSPWKFTKMKVLVWESWSVGWRFCISLNSLETFTLLPTNHTLSSKAIEADEIWLWPWGHSQGACRLYDAALYILPPQLLIFYPWSTDNADLFFTMLLAFSCLHSQRKVLKLQDSGLGSEQGKRPIHLQPRLWSLV